MALVVKLFVFDSVQGGKSSGAEGGIKARNHADQSGEGNAADDEPDGNHGDGNTLAHAEHRQNATV